MSCFYNDGPQTLGFVDFKFYENLLNFINILVAIIIVWISLPTKYKKINSPTKNKNDFTKQEISTSHCRLQACLASSVDGVSSDVVVWSTSHCRLQARLASRVDGVSSDTVGRPVPTQFRPLIRYGQAVSVHRLQETRPVHFRRHHCRHSTYNGHSN